MLMVFRLFDPAAAVLGTAVLSILAILSVVTGRHRFLWLWLMLLSALNVGMVCLWPGLSFWQRLVNLGFAIGLARLAWFFWRRRPPRKQRASRLLGYKARAARAKLLAALPKPRRPLRPATVGVPGRW